jgi:hypothetical protein
MPQLKALIHLRGCSKFRVHLSLSLLELNIWSRGTDSFVVASPPLRFQKKEFNQGAIVITDSEEISEENTGQSKKIDSTQLDKNREFWEDFIAKCKFDHPDQDAPRRLNTNSVRLPFPSPVDWVTCYRVSSGRKRIGIFMYFDDVDEENTFNVIRENLPELQKTFPELICQHSEDYKKGKPTVSLRKEIDVSDPSTIEEQKDWLLNNIRTWVNLFRPYLKNIN